MRKTLVPVLALVLLALSAPLFAVEAPPAAPSLNPLPAAAALAPAGAPASQPDAHFALWLTGGSGLDTNPSLNCQCFFRPCQAGYVCCSFASGGLPSCGCVPADPGCGN